MENIGGVLSYLPKGLLESACRMHGYRRHENEVLHGTSALFLEAVSLECNAKVSTANARDENQSPSSQAHWWHVRTTELCLPSSQWTMATVDGRPLRVISGPATCLELSGPDSMTTVPSWL